MNKKRTSLAHSNHFELFWQISADRKIDMVTASILLTLSYVEINIFHLQSFSFLTTNNNDTIFNVLQSTTYYFYLVNVIDISPMLYIILRIIFLLIPLVYFISYLIMLWGQHKNTPFKSIKKIFRFLYTYYIMVTFFPMAEFASREIFCENSLMSKLGEQCFQQLTILTYALVSVTIGLFMAALTHIYSFNGIYDKKNQFSGENKLYESLVTTFRFLLALIIGFSSKNNGFIALYLVANLIFSSILLTYFTYYQPYNKLKVENLVLFMLVLYFVQSLSFVLFFIITDNNQSVGVGMIFTILMVIISWGVFQLYQRRKMWTMTKGKITSTTDLMIMVTTVQQLKNHMKMDCDNELIFRGLIERHMVFCKDYDCFCKKDHMFDPKQRKSISMERRYFNRSVTLKFFIRQLFENELKKNKDPETMISYAELLFEKFRNTHLALYQIIQLSTSDKFLHPHFKFRIFKLKYKISTYINTINQEGLIKPLDIENVIFVEEQFAKILESMQYIIKAALEFWGYLNHKDIDLHKLHQLSKALLIIVDDTSKLWNPLKIYLDKKKKLRYYYNWFLKDFKNKKIVLTEEDIEDLLEDETYSIHSQEFIDNIKNDNILFQDDSCVIHISGHFMNMGKILNVSKAIQSVFGYEKTELQNSVISVLMPNLIGKNHARYLESFVKTGNSRILYNQRLTYAKEKSGHIFPIWLVVKQMNSIDGEITYAGLVRPLTEKKEDPSYYILLDQNGEIDGISKNLSEITLLKPDVLDKTGTINLIMLAPRLIKEFNLLDLLNADDDYDNNRDKINQSMNKSEDLSINADDKDITILQQKKNELISSLSIIDDEFDSVDGQESEMFQVTVDDTGSKIISFTLRIPIKLSKYVKEFNALRNRYQADATKNNQQKSHFSRRFETSIMRESRHGNLH